jgi:1-acyl-sn-glycerol-3-phosphate acyltransferase
LRYYWTIVVASLLFVVIGIPVITVGYLLRWIFGIENFVFPYAQFGVRLYVKSSGARVHVKGLEHIDPAQTYVFVANHQSTLDPPILFAYLGCRIGALAKKELSSIPILGQGMSLAHVIPVDRGNHDKAMASTRVGAEALRAGHSLMGFPEGTRTFDGRLKEFKKGVFYMAVEGGVPIVPVVFNDTRLVMPKGQHTAIPGDVYVEILPPVSTAGYSRENVEKLADKVRSLVIERVRHD